MRILLSKNVGKMLLIAHVTLAHNVYIYIANHNVFIHRRILGTIWRSPLLTSMKFAITMYFCKIQRDTLSEATVTLRTVVTFVTWLISRTEFLVEKVFYNANFLQN